MKSLICTGSQNRCSKPWSVKSPQVSSPVHITVTQEHPSEAPGGSTGLPYLLRASQRAETPIQLAPAEDHTIRIEVAPRGAVSFNAEQFQMLTVGPAGTIAAPVRFRPARIVLNRSTRTLRFYLGRFEDSNTPMPVRVRLPVPRQNENQEVRASLAVSMRWPHLRVRDLRNMDLANRMLREGGLLMELLVEPGNQLLGRTRLTRSERGLFPMGVWQGERLRGLTGLDGDQPVPLFVPPATLTGLVGVDSPIGRNSRNNCGRQRRRHDQKSRLRCYFSRK